VFGVSNSIPVSLLWFAIGTALILALPVTAVIMAGPGLAIYRVRRSFWLIIVGGWMLVSVIHEQISEAQDHFTLDKAAEVDGIVLPSTRVEPGEGEAFSASPWRTRSAVSPWYLVYGYHGR
jgi:hypothetical protein